MAIDKNIPDQGIDEAKLEKEVFSEEVELEAQEPEEASNVEMFEELNDGVKLVDLTTKEAVFQTEDTYLIMNFKNEIKEKSEY